MGAECLQVGCEGHPWVLGAEVPDPRASPGCRVPPRGEVHPQVCSVTHGCVVPPCGYYNRSGTAQRVPGAALRAGRGSRVPPQWVAPPAVQLWGRGVGELGQEAPMGGPSSVPLSVRVVPGGVTAVPSEAPALSGDVTGVVGASGGTAGVSGAVGGVAGITVGAGSTTACISSAVGGVTGVTRGVAGATAAIAGVTVGVAGATAGVSGASSVGAL